MTFDTSETQKVFGPVVIDYHQVRPYSFFFFFFFQVTFFDIYLFIEMEGFEGAG